MAKTAQEKIKRINQRFELADKNSSTRNAKLNDYRAMYNNTYTSAMMKEATFSQIHFPKAFGIVESQVARITSNDPVGTYKPVNDTFRSRLYEINSLFKHQWHKAGMQLKLMIAAKRGLVDGTVPYRLKWRYETKKVWKDDEPILSDTSIDETTGEPKVIGTGAYVDEVCFDGWDVDLLKRENVYLNPSWTPTKGQYNKTGKWVITEEVTCLDELEKINKLGGKVKYQNLKKLKDWLNLREEEKKNRAKLTADGSALTSGEQRGIEASSSDRYDSTEDELTIRYHKTGKRWEAMVPGFDELVMDIPNPYWHGELDLNVAFTDFDDDSTEGISDMEIGGDMFDAINTLISQKMDRGLYSMNSMLIGYGIDKSEKIKFENNSFVYAPANSKIEALNIPDTSMNTFQMEWNYLNQGIEAGLGYIDNSKQPQDANALQNTATGVRASERELNMRMAKKIKILEQTFIQPIAEQAFRLNYQYIQEPITIGVTDKQAIKYFVNNNEFVYNDGKIQDKFRKDEGGKQAFLTITHEDLVGDYIYEVDTESSMSDSEAELQKTMSFVNFLSMPFIAQNMQQQGMIVNIPDLIEKVANDTGIKNVDELLKTQEQVMQENPAMAQQAMMQQQQGGAVNPQSNVSQV